MSRLYPYVGSATIAEQAQAPIFRLQPAGVEDIRGWANSRVVECTYIVDPEGRLWLSDRHSEHVACARGRAVLGAGELVLSLGTAVSIVSITNQSTGYCPEATCWPAVRAALERAGLEPPAEFSHSFEFRRCTRCRAINVLKLDMPECGECGADLPESWNFDSS